MITVVAAVIERGDRRILIGQRRRADTSPLKWEFPGGKFGRMRNRRKALARELQEELGAKLRVAWRSAAFSHAYAERWATVGDSFLRRGNCGDQTFSQTVLKELRGCCRRNLGITIFWTPNRRADRADCHGKSQARGNTAKRQNARVILQQSKVYEITGLSFSGSNAQFGYGLVQQAAFDFAVDEQFMQSRQGDEIWRPLQRNRATRRGLRCGQSHRCPEWPDGEAATC